MQFHPFQSESVFVLFGSITCNVSVCNKAPISTVCLSSDKNRIMQSTTVPFVKHFLILIVVTWPSGGRGSVVGQEAGHHKLCPLSSALVGCMNCLGSVHAKAQKGSPLSSFCV